MLNRFGEIKFWQILAGITAFIIVCLVILITLDLSISDIGDIEVIGLDQRILYLGEGDICAVSNSQCKPGLICKTSEGFETGGGVCIRPDINGPFETRPNVPDYKKENYENWDYTDLE